LFALTRRTDYGIIALSHMAQRPTRVCTAREIAEQYHMPLSLLMNVLKSLCHAELVRSIRGAKGGYVLALSADQITLADIITAVEGPVRFVQCAGDGDTPCELIAVCPVSRPVRKVHERLVDFLGQVSLAQIAHDNEYGSKNVALSLEGVAMNSESI